MAENEKLEQTAQTASDKADKAKKDKKSEKKSKPGVFARIGKWLKDMKSELKKVQWPTRKQTVNNTLIVSPVWSWLASLSGCLTWWPTRGSA